MVTRILLDPRRDLPDGSSLTSEPVTVVATPTGVREDGSVFVLPSSLTFSVNTAADLIQLPASTASTGWRLTVEQGAAVIQTRTVQVPDTASVPWQSLVDVDPTSLTVTTGTARQWDATFAALTALLDGLNVSLAAQLQAVIGAAPTALNTLVELATAIGNDPTFAADMATALAGKSAALTIASVKTAAYTAAANEIVPVDATTAGVTVTLPTAPADRTRVVVKKLDATTNTVTVSRGGATDVFNKVGGSTTLTLSLQNQSTTVQYAASSGLWYVVAGDLPLSSLQASLAATYPALRSTPPDPAVVVAYIDTSTVPPVLKGWDGSSWVAIGNAAVDGALLTESGDYLTLETGDILLAA